MNTQQNFEIENELLRRYRFLLTKSEPPPAVYFKNIWEYRDSIKQWIDKLEKIIKTK
jgi:hypothetical protein